MSSNIHPHSQEGLEAWLAEQIATHVGVPSGQILPDVDFADHGLESVSAFVLCGDIETYLDLAIEPTAAWDHPTVRALAQYLRGQLDLRDGPELSGLGSAKDHGGAGS
ncbi:MULTISPECIES: acyl carrier protein [unclassified Streptomyces]|uniref:acyl carrier protein n=1 Tax=unclassified Streptomyces TaxID=2593676 RepID=UPI000DAD4F6C|nr:MULTISPECIES: acyl carrier protein [unclassified Streptomyces]PZT77068.1 polyketide synthase [Streptomyces sp. AC1-42W]PZT78979.1 polyketide synthase [Streptomyces sp. AC1-42T]